MKLLIGIFQVEKVQVGGKVQISESHCDLVTMSFSKCLQLLG